MAQGVLGQFLGSQDAVRGQRVDVQVALEQAQVFGGEGQLVDDLHALRGHLVCPEQDAPLARDQRAGPVTGVAKVSLTWISALIRTRSAHLAPVRGDQPEVDDVDLLPGR